MIKKTIFLAFCFYLLVLIQMSFLAHFNMFGLVPNFVLIAIIFINLCTSYQRGWGVVSAFAGGLFLDIFSISSSGFFGLYTLISLSLAFFINFILKKHTQVPIAKLY